MFAMIFGLVLLVLGLVAREYAAQDELAGEYDHAAMGSVIAFGCVVIGCVFVITGVAGW